MALLYGRAGRLTAKNGGFRPGQIFFTAEMALKLVGLGLAGYLGDGMNRFDGFIVLVSLVELAAKLIGGDGFCATHVAGGGGFITVLRAARLFRIFRAARAWGALRDVLRAVGYALPKAAPLSIVLFLFMVRLLLLAARGARRCLPITQAKPQALGWWVRFSSTMQSGLGRRLVR